MEGAGRNWNDFRRSSGLDLEAWTSFWTTHAQTRHAHEAYQLSLTTAGAGGFEIQGHRAESCEGNLVVIPPGEVHALAPCRGHAWRFDTIYLPELSGMPWEGASLSSLLDAASRLRPGESAAPEIATAFRRVHKAVASGLSQLTQEEHLVAFLESLTTQGFPSPGVSRELLPSRTALERVRAYLESCPEEDDVSLALLSELADLSPSHLSRAFRREFGLPPHAYLVQARVSRARALLKNGQPVCEVAAIAGFADQAHLTRHFKRLVGVTPGRYRLEGRIVQDREIEDLYT